MHTFMQVLAEIEMAKIVAVHNCISYACPYADFDKKWNNKNLVMQDCISYARAYVGFGKNEN